MSDLSLDAIERLIRRARTPADVFARFPYSVLALATRPDLHADDPRAEGLFRRVRELHDWLHAPAPVVRGAKRGYTLAMPVAVGDVADVYLAAGDGGAEPGYLVKLSRVPGGDGLLERERLALTALLAAAGDATYRKYLPTLAESFGVADAFPRRANVFLHEPGLFTLEQVHARHPALDARHLAWVFKRVLTAVGFAHRKGVVHGAVLPPHVLIEPEGHGVRLVGWGQSVEGGRPLAAVSTRFAAWYPPEVAARQSATPATDIFLAARCVVYLAGGDPTSGRVPVPVPAPLARFLRACLLEGPRMRPDDAWKLLDDFDDVLHGLYGPPQFRELTMD